MTKETPRRLPRLIQRLVDYFKDTRGELRKVSWPTRKQAVNLTLIVLAVTIAMAAFLGALDFLFSTVIRLIVDIAA